MATGASRELEITAFVASAQLPAQLEQIRIFSVNKKGTLGGREGGRAILIISVLG